MYLYSKHSMKVCIIKLFVLINLYNEKCLGFLPIYSPKSSRSDHPSIGFIQEYLNSPVWTTDLFSKTHALYFSSNHLYYHGSNSRSTELIKVASTRIEMDGSTTTTVPDDANKGDGDS